MEKSGFQFLFSPSMGKLCMRVRLIPRHQMESNTAKCCWGGNMKQFSVLIIFPLLAACLHDSHNGSAEGHAPEFASVGPRVVAVGELLEFSVTATDADGDLLSFSADARHCGKPNAQPPAIFESNSATFSWTPTTEEIGDYLVTLTVTEATDFALTDSETIQIRVSTSELIGRNNFGVHCAVCHGTGALGGSAPAIRGKDYAAIIGALTATPEMAGLQSQLTMAAVERVAEYLAELAPFGTHLEFDNTQSCESCHNHVTAIGRGVSHIFTTGNCAGCHSVESWIPAKVDHKFVQGTCASCHSGVTASAKPSIHVRKKFDCPELSPQPP